MKYELVITADTNDADYVTSTTEVDDEDIQKLMLIVEALKVDKGHYGSPRWATGDLAIPGDNWNPPPDEVYPQLTEEQIEWFGDLCPHGEYGIHTIVSIVYYPVPEKVRLI